MVWTWYCYFATGYRLDDPGSIPDNARFFSSSPCPDQTYPGTHKISYIIDTGTILQGVQRPEREDYQSPQILYRYEESCGYNSTHHIFMEVCLLKRGDKLFYVLLLFKIFTRYKDIPIDRAIDLRLSAKLVSTFADRCCHVVSVTNPYGRILDFLDRSRYFSFN
jgi:hypothetical protein